MTPKSYDTPSSFKQALEVRLRAQVQPGRDLDRLRQLLVFDRFLARIICEFEDAMVLKGGLALELRLARARTTKDVDVRFSGDPEMLLMRLQQAARLDLKDFLMFEVMLDPKHPQISGEGTIYDGQRFRVAATLAGKPYGRQHFGLDVGVGDPMISEPEAVRAEDRLGFIGVEPPVLRLYPLETHLAEKLHAYTLPRTAPNSRSKDLYDLALVSVYCTVEAGQLRAALEQTFGARGSHPVPDVFQDPPAFWHGSYEGDRVEYELPWETLEVCHRRAADFIEPVLTGLDAAAWDSKLGRWTPEPR